MSLTPAALGESPSGKAPGVPYSPVYDDFYHPPSGSHNQTRQVFMVGNGLPERWQTRTRFVILETGFGLGNNFLGTWAAWRADAQRCNRLVFISIEKHPLTAETLSEVHGLGAAPVPTSPETALAQKVVEAWPTLTPGIHTLHFDEPLSSQDPHQGPPQGVTLMLCLGDVAEFMPTLMAEVDAFYLDGFAPAKNPDMWDPKWLTRLHRLAAPQATAATWSSARVVRDSLSQAGFEVTRRLGVDGKFHFTQARYAPRYTAPPQAGGLWPQPLATDRHAIVVGAGLAGCVASWALCREGWRVTLVDQHGGPAQGGSGNPGGLFHSILHGDDGIHARAHRAAALATWRQVQPWIGAGAFAGQCEGLLRLDGKVADADARQLLSRLGLPGDHVQWLELGAARTAAGMDVPSGGWLFQQGGWLHPAGYAARLLQEAQAWAAHNGAPLTCLWHAAVARIAPSEGGWTLLDASGQHMAQAPSLVLASAHQATDLLATLPPEHAVPALPLSRVRGQISAWPLVDAQDADIRMPRLPVAGSGYVLPLRPDCLLFGATTQHHDEDPTVREADHRHNLRQAARLGACADVPDDAPLPTALQGRTGWRATTPDRLPLIGALPWSAERLTQAPARTRLDQVRLIPRERTDRGGLYVVSGLGSRGITWTALAGALLAHWVTGSPCPIESDLRDALDPARFLSRAHRH
ncbi:MAG: FAD-dependent 5-carboxymethylaminomethyl-2-thiouridine(34) oxidoreductase MnmC [Aquabacterium sp.]|jgi:tRNA 5-methylaminomethyl-2-thiouridine biosynthesis bifunctional protein|uniref:FAD-dependent 5-carboxymethylaminomethyl-2-thiouridine(34) oxidoreductase MnmC n=1 Tax=Aquabacterium sp. TaxID=1872578 RepID=UPI002A3686CE|nr:FAD-dependent 5-carboxymethylaminomethyl-2-thiouridine(34) oxidoreductase MnmC [Aquabacterium sp.]MDX9842251.1 FAD-dependent 5-carboxymethylaminomethyl-2-thiouridine(34) oxidoreductase MnmC [Aquabacterium sp.]